MSGNRCQSCSAVLTGDDVGLYKKMISRGAEEFLCKHCLAETLNCSEEYLDRKIKRFKEDGCLLFA